MYNKGLSFPEFLTIVIVALCMAAGAGTMVWKHRHPTPAPEVTVEQKAPPQQAGVTTFVIPETAPPSPPPAPVAPPVPSSEWLISDDKTAAHNIHMWVITNPKTNQKWLVTNWNEHINVTPGVIPDPVEKPKAPAVEAVEPPKARQ